MKTSSAKAKGRRLQNLLRDKLLATFSTLEEGDIRSTVMGMTGEDVQLSPKAQKIIPYAFECKNQEKLNVWKSFEQAESHSGDLETMPALVVARNRQKPLVVLDLEHFLKISYIAFNSKGNIDEDQT